MTLLAGLQALLHRLQGGQDDLASARPSPAATGSRPRA